jgi:23S rRNA pseudouridine2605 synthase
VSKTYAVKVRGTPSRETLNRLRGGLTLEDGTTRPARVKVARPASNTWLELSITEGRKHQVRRMLEAVGHPVLKLKRVAYDGLGLGDLPPGRLRPLTSEEVARLERAVRAGGRSERKSGGRPKRPKPS